ncbi:MAG: hypothetical protein C0483_00475 [Pirellula sp.]|nr:hypothetical protein [Pirellula sp.]
MFPAPQADSLLSRRCLSRRCSAEHPTLRGEPSMSSSATSLPGKIDINMTPMIDVVFQLMAFFLMTFQVAAVEGDFHMRLPSGPRTEQGTGASELWQVRLTADDDGNLSTWRLDAGTGGRGTATLPLLRAETARRLAQCRAAGLAEPQVELRCDDRLRYEHVLQAVEVLAGRQPGTGAEPDGRAGEYVRRLRIVRADGG